MSAKFKIDSLNRDNFGTWKVHMKALLIKNGTWKYVSKKMPTTEEEAEKLLEWMEEEEKAQADLILGISTSELNHVKDCGSAYEMWQKLHSVYESKGPARKASLLKNLILLKMKTGDDMRDHVEKFFNIVGKLQEMEITKNEELITILLLYSIPDDYEQFRIAIETQDKLISSENLKIKMIEEYEARNRNKEDFGDDNNALLVRGSKSGNFKFKCFTLTKKSRFN